MGGREGERRQRGGREKEGGREGVKMSYSQNKLHVLKIADIHERILTSKLKVFDDDQSVAHTPATDSAA